MSSNNIFSSKKSLYEAKTQSVEHLIEIDSQGFVFEVPLYTERKVTSALALRNLFSTQSVKIDGHCVYCSKDSVFHSLGDGLPRQSNDISGIHSLVFACQRDPVHQITVIVSCNVENYFEERSFGPDAEHLAGTILKIGQLPSHADIAKGAIGRYSKVLKGDDRAEFIRANGLSAVGVHIGSFVYLRRVFERLLQRAKERAGSAIDDEAYLKSRVGGRIDLLKDYLPRFMVENKRIYSVLSTGIHELDEASCAKYYQLMNQSCLLMLEQEKELKEKKALEENLQKSIAAINLGAEEKPES